MNFVNRISIVLLAVCLPISAQAQNEQGVVVTVENRAPLMGSFQTPVWVGFHDGSFDIYDRNAPANLLPIPGSDAVERLAEDGNTGPISDDFSLMMPSGIQTTIISNTPGRPPLAPGESSSRLFRLNPSQHQFFSYASMIIPSNDAFIANGNPEAHPLFNRRGRLTLRNVRVGGDEVLDAGVEVNDEVPANTAFFGQMAPNTGLDEDGVILTHPGFLPLGSGGILDDPMFLNADFTQSRYQTVRFRFARYNLDRENRFNGVLTTGQEMPRPVISGKRPFGLVLTSTDANNSKIGYFISIRNLSGEPTLAHFHLGPRGQNGPVVANLLGDNGTSVSFAGFTFITGELDAEDVLGPLANGEAPFDNLLANLAIRNIYVNIHTEANPAGEIRAQLR